ncbi:MAG: YebC/PmpR family DNA-binding transcriptional regulator [Candidatus Omnitrophota bacterium]|nr:YebC/PmpR family DNA-binding transcriptional regulator [Candidatus Omnitrophota bacterium]
MSGHSKWAGIKHKKALLDAKKGAVYTKIIREITATAKNGGGNPEQNASLRTAIAKAREANMPQDNVINAIKKGTGELPGVVYENTILESYGPGGVAILIECLTDNKNRTTAEIRNILGKRSGSMAGAGSVSWMFTKKGFFMVDKSVCDEDKLMSIVLDAGAEDMKAQDKSYEVTCAPQDLEKVKTALKEKSIAWQSAEVTMLPSSTVQVTGGDAKQVLALVEALEEHEDVQNVYANFDIPDEVLEEIAKKEE